MVYVVYQSSQIHSLLNFFTKIIPMISKTYVNDHFCSHCEFSSVKLCMHVACSGKFVFSSLVGTKFVIMRKP